MLGEGNWATPPLVHYPFLDSTNQEANVLRCNPPLLIYYCFVNSLQSRPRMGKSMGKSMGNSRGAEAVTCMPQRMRLSASSVGN